jgi:Family of unknown function (DUF5686)
MSNTVYHFYRTKMINYKTTYIYLYLFMKGFLQKIGGTLMLLLLLTSVNAQSFIQGKVFESDSITIIENINILNLNTNAYSTTNNKGKFKLENLHIGDSIRFTRLGYYPTYYVVSSLGITINFYIIKNKEALQSIRVFAKGDIISNILKKVQKNKEKNNPFSDNMEIELYNNITLQLNELDRIKGTSKAIKKIIKEYRDANKDADSTYIPVFLSEANSDVFIRHNPFLQKEIIKYTQVKSIGVASDGIVNELVGSSFQAVNFYNNQVTFLGKKITSPIASNWKTNFKYNYYGIVSVDDRYCYKLGFSPSNAKDIAFSGEMCIDTSTYALYKIKVYLDARANINFVKSFTIEQFFDTPEGFGKLYPTETVTDISVSLNRKDGLGMQAHLSASALKVRKTEPKDIAFYTPAVERLENSITKSDSFWNSNRSANEVGTTLATIAQIASIENSPTISKIDKTFRFLAGGYLPVKSNYQYGPYFNIFSHNSIEGNRFSLGFRYRDMLQKRLLTEGYVAYGIRDKKIKCMVNANYIVSKKPWITADMKFENDIRRVGITTLMMSDNTLSSQLIQFSNHWGNLRKAYHTNSFSASLYHEIAPGMSQKVTGIYETIDPLYNFQFHEKEREGKPNIDAKDMLVKEINYEFRFNKSELIVRNNTKRAVKIKKNRNGFNYIFKYTFGGAGAKRNYIYHKFLAEASRKIPMNKFGNGNVLATVAYTPSTIPYPLLFIQIGNPTPIMSKYGFNTMNFFEFTTDKYFRFQYIHNFEGYLTNRIPLVKKANLRTHITTNILWGDLSDKNRNLIPDQDSMGNQIARIKTLKVNKPFIEAGFGVSNIFKVLRLDVFHRFTYLKQPPQIGQIPFKERQLYFKASILFGL